ncbi:MAG: VOC family protein [Proteobacteria bacterium]|nr:MAG: VOC family protein [Pseudomonadota bacterium]
MKLSSLRIVSNNVPQIAEFYETLTGIKAVGDADYVEFQAYGSCLVFCSRRSLESYQPGTGLETESHSVILEFEVADVDAERQRLSLIVKDWVQEPTNHHWGSRSMLLKDPDGNLINLFAQIN